MADVFEPLPALAKPRERLWDLMAETPWLDWQLLTKRPEEVAGMVPWGEDWPANVWLGTSVENQEWADKRIPILLSLPAKVRFLSCEPLVGEVDLEMCDWTPPSLEGFSGTHNPLTGEWWPAVGDPDEEYRNRLTEQPQVNWVIVGGESGPHARRMDLAWAQRLVDQCDCAEVPCFVKQLGAAYRQPKDSHGADMAYWPESLRVRQMPESVGTAPGQAVLL
jgi:protein gp37